MKIRAEDRFLLAAGKTLAAFVVAAAIVPLYLLAKQAISPELDTFAWPPMWLPHRLTLAHFADVFAVEELRGAFIRSIAVAIMSAAGATVLGAMLGHAMARGSLSRRLGFSTVSGARLMPMITIAIPLGIMLAAVGIYDSTSGAGLALVHAALATPLAALTMYSGFAAIPLEIEEAAWIDGASPLRIFVSIDAPLVRGTLATSFILSFILSWDEFGFALLIQQTHRTLPPLLYYYTVFGNVGPASALALLMMIPAICVVVALGPSLRGAFTAGSSR